MKIKKTNKKIKKAIIKLVILMLLLVLAIKVFTSTLAKFESTSSSSADIDIAFYVLNKDFQEMTTSLDSIYPKNDPYIYTFSISNSDGTNTADVDLQYELQINTTTNLPLTYELYMNQSYSEINAQNIIKTNTVEIDDNNTYYRKITTDPIQLNYTSTTTNIYQLIVYFPGSYNTEDYQDIIESIEITVNSNQIS